MSNMQKPITVLYEEFVSRLYEDINTCGLPPFIITSVLKNMYHEASDLSQKQFVSDLKEYKSSIAGDKADDTN